MDERKRVGLLIAILVLVVAVAGSVATALLYRTAVAGAAGPTLRDGAEPGTPDRGHRGE